MNKILLLALSLLLTLPLISHAQDWEVEYLHEGTEHSLDIDSTGIPQIAFEIEYGESDDASDLYYGRFSGDWLIENIAHFDNAGAGLDLCIDTSDRPQIGYSEEVGQGIYYAVKVGSGWQTEQIRGKWTWNDVSLALNRSNEPYIICGDNTYRILRCYFKEGANWQYELITEANNISNVATAFDLNNMLHIVYYSHYATYYAYRTDEWVVEELGQDFKPSRKSLAVDSQNNLHIVGTSSGQVIYGYKDATGWYFEELTPYSSDVLSPASLSLNNQGEVCIAYINYTRNKVNYIYEDSNRWLYQTVFHNTDPNCEFPVSSYKTHLTPYPAYIVVDPENEPLITFNLTHKDTAKTYVMYAKPLSEVENHLPLVGTLTNKQMLLATTYSDADGWENIKYAALLINTRVNGKNCFFGRYNQNSNRLYLRDNDNRKWRGGFTPGSDEIIENSYVLLDCAKTTVSGQGNTLTINWAVTFKNTFINAVRNIYLRVWDDEGASSGWKRKAIYKSF